MNVSRTAQRLRVFSFVAETCRRDGCWPMVREVVAALGISGTAAKKHLAALDGAAGLPPRTKHRGEAHRLREHAPFGRHNPIQRVDQRLAAHDGRLFSVALAEGWGAEG